MDPDVEPSSTLTTFDEGGGEDIGFYAMRESYILHCDMVVESMQGGIAEVAKPQRKYKILAVGGRRQEV